MRGGSCWRLWHHETASMRGSRWLLVVVVAISIALTSHHASAQAFKSRGTAKPPASAKPADAAATSSKSPTRSAGPRRVVTTKKKPKLRAARDEAPIKKKQKKGKQPSYADDYMVIIDEAGD